MTLALVAPMAFAAGCTSEEDYAAAQAARQGLTLFSQDSVQGLSGMYAEGDAVVFFDTMQDPDGPAVSGRWVDREGRNVLLEMAGAHTPAYAKWGLENDQELNRVAPVEGSLDLIVRGAAALGDVALDPLVASHQQVLVEMASAIPPADERTIVLPADQRRSDELQADVWQTKIEIIDHQAHQCTKYHWYEESNMGVMIWKGSQLNKNGHGDSPECTSSRCSVWDNNKRTYYKTFTRMCTTIYAYCSSGNRHNCLNDTMQEVQYVKHHNYCDQGSSGNCTNTRTPVFNSVNCSEGQTCACTGTCGGC